MDKYPINCSWNCSINNVILAKKTTINALCFDVAITMLNYHNLGDISDNQNAILQ